MGPEIGALATTVLMMTIEALELFGDTVQCRSATVSYPTGYTVFVHEDTHTVTYLKNIFFPSILCETMIVSY
jgi:hypothetical protein